jgi:AraC-like DNA-binding protein
LNLRLVRLKAGEEWLNKGDGLVFIFPKGGLGRYVSGSLTQRLAVGDVLVLNASIGGKLCTPEKGEMLFWCFSLCLEQLFPLFYSNEISLVQTISDIFKSNKLYPASSSVALECHRLLQEVPPQFNLDHRSQLLRVAAVILTVEFKTAQPRRAGFVRVEEHMLQVFEKLSSNELLNSSVGELAAKFGCSRRHLNRLFHQHFGVSVAALRMEMRLLKAVSLLRDPDAKVINVAEACGFNHLGLFNTCFKRRFGASPGQWRKRAAESENEPSGSGPGGEACPLRISGLCPWSPNPTACASTGPEPTAQKPAPSRLLISVNGIAEGVGTQVLADKQNTREEIFGTNPLRGAL